jgi:hypothetical protein
MKSPEEESTLTTSFEARGCRARALRVHIDPDQRWLIRLLSARSRRCSSKDAIQGTGVGLEISVVRFAGGELWKLVQIRGADPSQGGVRETEALGRVLSGIPFATSRVDGWRL